MLTADLVTALIGLVSFMAPIHLMRRRFPRFTLKPEVSYPTLEANQFAYRKTLVVRTAITFAFLAVAIWMWWETALWRPVGQVNSNVIAVQFGLLIGAAGLGQATANLLNYQWTKKLLSGLPEYETSIPPAQLIALVVAITVVPCGIISVTAIATGNYIWTGIAFIVAVFLFSVLQRLTLRYYIKRQATLDAESPLGLEIAEMVRLTEFPYERSILLRSAYVNGFALKNGSISVTTMLATLFPPRQVAATLAHEVSHVRDNDLKKLQSARRVATLMITPMGAAAGIYIANSDGLNPYVIPAGFASFIALLPLVQAVMAVASRKIEYKCDRFAATWGYGPDLQAGLVTLHRIMGLPERWEGIDRWTLTHPCLADRLVQLEKFSDEAVT